MQTQQVQEIANDLFDGDSSRFHELILGVDEKFKRLAELEMLLQEMANNPPGNAYFLPWAEKLANLGINGKQIRKQHE